MIDGIKKTSSTTPNNKVSTKLINLKKGGFKDTRLLKDMPEYSFLNLKMYSDLKKVTGDIKINDVLGEGYNGIVINHPRKKDRIIKIAKPNTFDLREEAETHGKFRKKIDLLKKDGQLSNKIKVPLIEVSGEELFYVMEKVKGKCFTTKFYYEHYRNELKNYNTDELKSLSDYGVKKLLRDNGNIVIQCSEGLGNSIEQLLLDKKYEGWWQKKKSEIEIGRTLELLEEDGYEHGDAHGGNIMEDENGDFYLIDFGTSQVENSEFN